MTNKVTDSTYQPRVQWYWKSNNNVKSTDEKEEWIKYSDSESEIIEEAFCGTNKKVWFELNHYWTNLYNFIQINKYDQNKQRQIKRVGINGNEILAASEGSLSPDSRPKSFHESGLEGGIAFIYDWKKRNATLSNSEIVIQAANGILVEINQSDIVCIRKEKLKWLIDVLLSIKDASETDILKFCICMYTQVEYLFQLMNETLRENDKTKIDTLAPYCYFLTEAIWSNALNPERYKSTVYRGVCLDPDLIRHYKDAIGTYKCWYGFSSASKTPEVASIFGDNVLFIIDVSCAGALDISSYSVIPDEQEVILPPGTTFRIDNVEHSDSKTYIYIFVVPEIRMVLLGRTGTGKSSVGNIILGKRAFDARPLAKSITTKCKASDRIWDNRRLVVVDTPGFFDTELSPDMIIPEISSSYQVAAPGPDVFLIVFTFVRFTQQEEAAAKWISQVFDERALDYCIIVFTGLDSLKRHKITVEEFLQDAPVFLQNLLEKCNGRYIAFDDLADDHEKEQTTKILLEKISTMVQNNGGQYYNNNKFIQIATILDKCPGWFDPLKPDGTVNLLPETNNIVAHELIHKTIFTQQ